MRRVPQPNVERSRSFNIDQNRGEKLWVKIQGDETKEPTIWETKFGEKSSEIEIAGMTLREGN